MRTLPVVLVGLAALLAVRAPQAAEPQTPAAPPAQSAWVIPEDEKIWEYLIKHRQEMIRVTDRPFHVGWAGSTLCLRPNTIPHSPHGEHWIHVYVSPGGREAMTTGKGTYPEGTILLKQKFFDEDGTRTDFYTGMRKREAGYSPELGDWEFFTLDAEGDTVTARGKIESCMGCHAAWPATDFVSRRYMAEPTTAATAGR